MDLHAGPTWEALGGVQESPDGRRHIWASGRTGTPRSPLSSSWSSSSGS